MHFGELLRRLRGPRTQKEVSSDLDMPVTTLSSLEHQESIPRGPVLKKLADYYSVPITYFYSAPTSEVTSSSTAKEWLHSLRTKSGAAKDAIATLAPPEYPEDVKQKFARKIQLKKNAEAADNK